MVNILDSRSQSYVGSTLSPYKVGSLNSKLFLSEISKREKNLCKMLEGMRENKYKTLYPAALFLKIINCFFIPFISSSVQRSCELFPEHSGIPVREAQALGGVPRRQRQQQPSGRQLHGLFLLIRPCGCQAAVPESHSGLCPRRRSVLPASSRAVWFHPARRKQQLSLWLSTLSALGLGIPALPLPKRQLLPAAPVRSAEDPDVHGR